VTDLLELANVVGGRAVPSASERRLSVLDPTTGEIYATAPDSGPGDVDAACASASAALADWRGTPPARRAAVLLAVADALEAAATELAGIEVADTGKPWQPTLDDEVLLTIDQLRFFAGAARLLGAPAAAEYVAGVTSAIRREPLGVCGQITPWNYPFMMAVWKWAPALAAGNTVVLKPSELTPASTLRTAEIVAGILPPGVHNVVCGGAATGELVARNPAVAMVALTGSPRAGRAVAGAAAERLARTHLELGGNAPVVVFADADLAAVAEAVAYAAYFNAGQDCTAASRVLVEADAHEDLVALLVKEAGATRTGDPFDPGVTYGPLAGPAQLERVQGLLARLRPGAEIVAGGRALDRPGFFHEPTVVTGVGQEDEIVQEEIFGPVITVQPFVGEAEALILANGVDQGLVASVWTTDHGRAGRLCRDLDFGSVAVNTHAPMAAELPHGGFGMSGHGIDLSLFAVEEYTRVKHVAHAW
jgi:betaine-aldehyde dehydrogenase